MKHPEFASRLYVAWKQCKKAPRNQARLAEALNLTPTIISEYLHGNKLPSAAHGVEIATQLDVSYDWLMTGRGPQRPGGDECPGVSCEGLTRSQVDFIKKLINLFLDENKLDGNKPLV